MSAISWLDRLFTKKSAPVQTRKPTHGSTRRMAVEVLEDRCMPAAIYVTSFVDGASTPLTARPGGGLNAANLRSAVDRFDELSGNSTIYLETGTYELTLGEMVVNYDANTTKLKIINRTSAGISTIDANDDSRIFVNTFGLATKPGTLTLERLKLLDGRAPDTFSFPGGGNFSIDAEGGAIYNEGALELYSTQFVDNKAIAASRNSNFNTGYYARGGAIYNAESAKLTIRDSTFDNNYAQGGDVEGRGSTAGGAEGGAIYSSGSSRLVSITATTFSHNSALGGDVYVAYGGEGYGYAGDALGAAIAMGEDFNRGQDPAEVTIVNSTFFQNGAHGGNGYGAEGGADFVVGGDGLGGALFVNRNIHLRLANVTIAENDATGGTSDINSIDDGFGEGGGVYAGAEGGGFVPVDLVNTIIAKNDAQTDQYDDIFGRFNSLGHNLIGNNDGASFGSTFDVDAPRLDQLGNTASPLDPDFDPLGLQANGAGPNVPKTLGLLAYSPAINTGDNAVTQAGSALLTNLGISRLVYDERGKGFGRKVLTTVDIGAFEFQMNLNKFYKFKSSRTTSTTLSVAPSEGLLKNAYSFLPIPPAPQFYLVGLYGAPPSRGVLELLPNGNLDYSDGSFTFTVPPRFIGTVTFQFRVYVALDAGLEKVRSTNLVFTATIQVVGPATGRGSAGNFLGIGGGTISIGTGSPPSEGP